ncbi:hypothetical protein TSH58p_24575 (plasmid) [Azospirillum sp. TSH58]|uniref:hypothetical protein n=1 Tax=Azospirillum sp. TSH58 TaxID=664962 RepID=UPI000D6018E7|nr:hypothetical protein [Azospirillum sp. TSH58]AWJ86650.1 hypothetical protein TSH58p_24575 [Azospirillum sp. TSH58]PWC61735.1 hypothetical protein TSH58_26500 [Azospirillum sp. TSH58]
MTTDPKALLSLGTKLLDIDEARFRQVVDLLQQIGDHPEVQHTFSLIRPRLAEVRPKRRPTFKRLFCEPFEDLFQLPGGDQPAPLNKLDRGVVNALWPLVEGQIGKERLRGVDAALGGPGNATGGAQQAEKARAFWSMAAAAVADIREQTETGRFADDLGLRLNPDRVRTIEDIARILTIAQPVAELKAILSPKPIQKLHKDHLDGIQAIGRQVARSRPEALKLFILLAAARLSDPSILLGSLWDMDLGQKSSDRAALFLDLGGTVVAQIEERSRGAGSASGGTVDRMAAATLAVDLVASLEATRNAMEHSRNKDFDQRLKTIRNSVHELVRTQVLDGADTEILSAVETLVPGTDTARMAQAENQARALRKCSTIADTLGLRGELKSVTQQATASLTGTARQSLANGVGDARTGYTAIRMIELIAGPAEANQVMDDILRGGRR